MVRTLTFDAQSEPLIRTFQEENEEQTRMVVHKDPLEGIDTSGMTLRDSKVDFGEKTRTTLKNTLQSKKEWRK